MKPEQPIVFINRAPREEIIKTRRDESESCSAECSCLTIDSSRE
jgi:hypothetical protein